MRSNSFGRWALPRVRCLAWGIFLLLPLGWCAHLAGLGINMTPSVPVGLWWIHPGAISRGEYVKVCLPEQIARLGIARGYLREGSCSPEKVIPVIKRVIALPGDVVLVDANEVRINGVPIPISRRRNLDTQGRPIPSNVHLGTSIVAVDHVWVFGESLISWDSRYYGALPMSSIRGVAVPLLVLRR